MSKSECIFAEEKWNLIGLIVNIANFILHISKKNCVCEKFIFKCSEAIAKVQSAHRLWRATLQVSIQVPDTLAEAYLV